MEDIEDIEESGIRNQESGIRIRNQKAVQQAVSGPQLASLPSGFYRTTVLLLL
jgi:hypothetical protein